MYTRFRKKFILPILWWFRERRKLKGLVVPSKREILEARRDFEKKLREYEREKLNDAISETKGKISILDWLLNG